MSACERATIATGVSLRAQLGGSLTCIALDSDDTTGLLLNASLAEGADRAVQIHAPECAGLDYFGIANVLAEITVRLGCDLALCAEHDEHGALYAFGPAMAEILGLRYLSGVIAVEALSAPEADFRPVMPLSDDIPTLPTMRVSDLAASPAFSAPHERSTDADTTDPTTIEIPIITRAQAEAGAPATPSGLAVVAFHRGLDRVYRFRCPLPALLSIASMPMAVSNPSATSPSPTPPTAASPERRSLTELGIDARPQAHRSNLAGQVARIDTADDSPVRIASNADELIAWLVADGIVR